MPLPTAITGRRFEGTVAFSIVPDLRQAQAPAHSLIVSVTGCRCFSAMPWRASLYYGCNITCRAIQPVRQAGSGVHADVSLEPLREGVA